MHCDPIVVVTACCSPWQLQELRQGGNHIVDTPLLSSYFFLHFTHYYYCISLHQVVDSKPARNRERRIIGNPLLLTSLRLCINRLS